MIAKDGDDNVIIASSIDNFPSDDDVRVIKRNASGDLVWEKLLDAPGAGQRPVGVGVDSKNMIYVSILACQELCDTVVTKLTPTGDIAWMTRQGEATLHLRPRRFWVNPDGSSYVAGDTGLDVFFGELNFQYTLSKFGSMGDLLWTTHMNPREERAAKSRDAVRGLLVRGNAIAITGSLPSTTTPSRTNIYTVRYTDLALTQPIFVRGDANADGNQNLTDAVFVLGHLFGGGEAPPCAKSADVNDSGAVDLTDPVLAEHAIRGRPGTACSVPRVWARPDDR